MATSLSINRGIDHLVVAVPDLNEAISRYQALGFTTTPKAMHPWGTGNALVQLDRSFFELLSIEDASAMQPAEGSAFGFGEFNQRFLRRRQHGLSMLVFSTMDAQADRARWQSAGLDVYDPFGFARKARLPDGKEVEVSFSLSFVTHPEMPWAAWFVCQQHAPEHFWKPQYQSHPNTAQSLLRVWMVAPEPHRYTSFLSALFDEGELSEDDATVDLQLPYGGLALVTPEHAREHIPGFDPAIVAEDGPRFVAASLRVSDLAASQSRLHDSGIDTTERDAMLWVDANDACGVSLSFQ